MLIKLAWKNLWRNKIRTSIMLGAITFGLVGVVSMMGFMSGMVDSMIHNAIAWQTSHIQIHNNQYLDNPDIKLLIKNGDALISKIDSLNGVKTISSRFLADGMIASARSNRGVRINGVEAVEEATISPILSHIQTGEWLGDKGRNPVVISQKTAQRLKLRVGSKVVLTFSDFYGDVTGAAFRVRGIFKTPSTTFDDGNVYVRKSDLQTLAKSEGVHEIAVLLDSNRVSVNNPTQDIQLSESIRHIEAFTVKDFMVKGSMIDSTIVQSWIEIQPILATMLSTMSYSNQIMLVVFVAAMAFGIVNIMLMSVFERTREFGVLMAIGMQKHKIFKLIMLETIFLGICGATLGVGVSILLIYFMNIYGLPLGSMAQGLGAYGVDTVLYPRVSASEYQMIFTTIIVASALAAIYPARQILKQNPVSAMAEKH